MTAQDLLNNLQKLTPEQLKADCCVRAPRGTIYDMSESVTFADVADGRIVGDAPTCIIFEADC